MAELRKLGVTPHVAQNTNGQRSATDGRTPRHPGYTISLRIRKRIEEAFGWAKTVAGLRKARHRGLPKVDWQFTLAMAAYNLVRLPKLLAVRRDARIPSRARRRRLQKPTQQPHPQATSPLKACHQAQPAAFWDRFSAAC